jgi:hypothetical protein
MRDAVAVTRVLRAVGSGALLGAVTGVVARLLMRVVALVTEDDPAFTWGASLAIVGLFVLSGAGAGAAATFASRRWLAFLVVAVTSLPVVLIGTAIGVGEVASAVDEGVAGLRRLALFGAAVVILGLAYTTPYLAWRRQPVGSLAAPAA